MRGGLLDRLERGSLQENRPEPEAADAHEDVVRRVQSHIIEAHPGLLGHARHSDEGRQQLRAVIQTTLARDGLVASRMSRDSLTEEILNGVTGLGPLEPLLQDDTVTEIMVNGYNDVWVERAGQMKRVEIEFKDDQQLTEIINRAVAPLGRRIDQSVPFVDGRLPGGSRMHACIAPISLRGPILTIRKFPKRGFTLPLLVELGTLTPEAATFLAECVRNRLNVVVAGGTSSGKTCTLNALLTEVQDLGERIVTIEDCAELSVAAKNLVSLESRPANIEGKGEITIRTLVKNALRMRPDRIIVGEVRGAEAFDMLQAMNTGHQGSMSTVHANSPSDAIKRLDAMALLAPEVPDRVVHELIPSAIDVVVYQRRLSTGERLITEIALMKKSGPSLSSDALVSVFSCVPGGRRELKRTDGALPEWFHERAAWRSV